MPAAPRYEFVARNASGIGIEARHSLRSSVEITLTAHYYARYALFDESGAPIEVRNRIIACSDGATVYTTGGVPLGATWNAGRSLLAGKRIQPNEVLVLYRGTDRMMIGDQFPQVEIPGFAPCRIPYIRRALDEWPATERLVLRKTGHRKTYRIAFPDSTEGRAVGLLLNLANRTRLVGVTRTFNLVDLVSTEGLELRQRGFAKLQVSIDEIAGTITPRYPKYGYLEIRYKHLLPTPAIHSLVARQERGTGALYAKLQRPGVAVIGPVPTGLYRLELHLGTIQIGAPVHVQPSVNIVEGDSTFEWR